MPRVIWSSGNCTLYVQRERLARVCEKSRLIRVQSEVLPLRCGTRRRRRERRWRIKRDRQTDRKRQGQERIARRKAARKKATTKDDEEEEEDETKEKEEYTYSEEVREKQEGKPVEEVYRKRRENGGWRRREQCVRMLSVDSSRPEDHTARPPCVPSPLFANISVIKHRSEWVNTWVTTIGPIFLLSRSGPNWNSYRERHVYVSYRAVRVHWVLVILGAQTPENTNQGDGSML